MEFKGRDRAFAISPTETNQSLKSTILASTLVIPNPSFHLQTIPRLPPEQAHLSASKPLNLRRPLHGPCRRHRPCRERNVGTVSVIPRNCIIATTFCAVVASNASSIPQLQMSLF